MRACSVSGTSSCSTGPTTRYSSPNPLEQLAVEQHAHGLDRVEGDAVGALVDLLLHALREPLGESRDQLVHVVHGQRLEEERGEVALARAPVGTTVGELGPREREDEERLRPRPLEHVLDEVQQAGVAPVQILEDEHARALVGEALEEDAPGREEVVALPAGVLLEPEQVGEARLDPGALVRVGDVLLERRMQLGCCRRRVLLLDDACAPAHHLGERPVGDALAVGQAPPSVPPDLLGQPVDVLEELPSRRDLPMPATPVTETSRVRCSSAVEWYSSLMSRNSLSRPTNGASRPTDLSAPARPAVTCRARQRCIGSALPFIACVPPSSYAIAASDARRVASPTSTVPGSAADWMREAVLTRSPATMPWPSAPTVTAASPVSTPERTRSWLTPASAPSVSTASTSPSAARTARSASSSCAVGAPQTAMTASPMNFSTVPP